MKIKFSIKTGKLKNKKIIFSKLYNTKPTKDIIKKNIIYYINNFKEKYTLDLFAGTGVICFELYSKNIKKIILIEIEEKIIKDIKNNKESIIKKGDFFIYKNNAYDWINKLNFLNISFILFDPPYNFKDYNKYLTKINKIKNLKKCLTIIIESNIKIKISNNNFNFFFIKKEKIGKTMIQIIKKI